jgi:hypothetical protein
MRHLLFLTYVCGALLGIDALCFRGEYRTTLWQDATYQGQAFTLDLQRWLRRSLW